MTYLLDTNSCVMHLRSRGQSAVSRRLTEVGLDQVVLCAIVRGELLVGAYRSQKREQNLRDVLAFCVGFESLPFDDSAADHYGRLRAELTDRGTPIGPNDLLIAAIALAHDLTLVTHNTREFSRVAGLRIEDWEQAG